MIEGLLFVLMLMVVLVIVFQAKRLDDENPDKKPLKLFKDSDS